MEEQLPTQPDESLTWAEFERVELRAGTIVEAEASSARKPSYRLRVDLGPQLGVRTSSAQLTKLYEPGDLLGRQVLCVTNFAPMHVGPVRSEVLVTGFVSGDGEVVLAVPERRVQDGARLA